MLVLTFVESCLLFRWLLGVDCVAVWLLLLLVAAAAAAAAVVVVFVVVVVVVVVVVIVVVVVVAFLFLCSGCWWFENMSKQCTTDRTWPIVHKCTLAR